MATSIAEVEGFGQRVFLVLVENAEVFRGQELYRARFLGHSGTVKKSDRLLLRLGSKMQSQPILMMPAYGLARTMLNLPRRRLASPVACDSRSIAREGLAQGSWLK